MYCLDIRSNYSSIRLYATRAVFYFLVVAAHLLLVTPSQAANSPLSVKLLNEDASPVELLGAEGLLNVFDESQMDRFFNNQTSSTRYFNNKNSRSGFPYWQGTVRYRNKTRRQIKTVTFLLKFLDKSGKTISFFKSTVKRDLPPAREYSYHWNDMVSGSAIANALIRTTKVEFLNGTEWVSKEYKENEDAVMVALRIERERLKAIYEEEGIERMLEVLYR